MVTKTQDLEGLVGQKIVGITDGKSLSVVMDISYIQLSDVAGFLGSNPDVRLSRMQDGTYLNAFIVSKPGGTLSVYTTMVNSLDEKRALVRHHAINVPKAQLQSIRENLGKLNYELP